MFLLSLAGPLTKGLNAHALNNNTSGSICILKHSKFKKSEDFQNLIPMKRVHASAHRLTEKMPRCAGDCDSNAHCAKGLYCFQRNDKSAIPGCLSTTQDINTWDYCYFKSTTVNKNQKIIFLTNQGGSGHLRAMKVCEGDCDRDSHCGIGLRCYQRNDKRTIPGCVSGGKGDVNGWDYCYAKAPTHTCSCPSGQAGNGPSSPSSLLHCPPISQYLLEPASVVWALQFVC